MIKVLLEWHKLQIQIVGILAIQNHTAFNLTKSKKLSFLLEFRQDVIGRTLSICIFVFEWAIHKLTSAAAQVMLHQIHPSLVLLSAFYKLLCIKVIDDSYTPRTLRAAAANLNSACSKYAKVSHVHYFCTMHVKFTWA